MRISNLIDALTKIKENYGDLRVGVSDSEGEACGCETIVHEEERYRCVSHEEALFSNAYGSPEPKERRMFLFLKSVVIIKHGKTR